MRILNKQTNKANHKFLKYSALTSALFTFSIPSFAYSLELNNLGHPIFNYAYNVSNENTRTPIVKRINPTDAPYDTLSIVSYTPNYPYQFTVLTPKTHSLLSIQRGVITSWTFEGLGLTTMNGLGEYNPGKIGDSTKAPLNDWFQGISKGESPTMVVLRRVDRNSSEPVNLGRKLMVRTGEELENLTELPGQDRTDKYAFGYISDDGNKIVVNEKINDSHTRGVIFSFSNKWENDRTLDNPANTNSSFINLGSPDANVLVGESRNDNSRPFSVVWTARNNWAPIILSSWQGDNLGNQIKQISNDGNTLFGLSAVNAQENAATVWQGDNWQNKYQLTTFSNTATPNFMKMTDDGKIVAVDKSLWSYDGNKWNQKEFENDIISMTESGRFVVTKGQGEIYANVHVGENWKSVLPIREYTILTQNTGDTLSNTTTLLNSFDRADDDKGSSMEMYFALHDPEDFIWNNNIVVLNISYAKPEQITNPNGGNNTGNGGNGNGSSGDNGNGGNNTNNSGNDNGNSGNNTNNSGNDNGNSGNNTNNSGNDNGNSGNNTNNSGNDNGNGGNNTSNGGNNGQPNNTNNGNPTSEQPTKPAQPNTSNGNITVTEVVKINVPNTQKSILKIGHDTFELFSLQFGALRRLQEECVAGKGEICYALQHNYAAQNGNYDNAVNLRVGYGFTDNLTFGVNFDRSLRRSLPDTYRRLSGNGGVGAFGHYQLPYNAYISAGIGWDYYRIQAQRPLLANTEFAPTKSRVRGLAWNVTVGQDFTLSNDSQLGWYLAYRQTEIKRDGYRENVPGFPVEYGAANLKDNAIAVGAKFALPITPKLSWISAVEFERRLGGESPVYSAKAQYVGDVLYQADLNHSRWNAQSGLRYAFAPNLSLSLTPFWGNSIVGNNQWGTKLTLEGRF